MTVLVHERIKNAIHAAGINSFAFVEPKNWIQLQNLKRLILARHCVDGISQMTKEDEYYLEMIQGLVDRKKI